MRKATLWAAAAAPFILGSMGLGAQQPQVVQGSTSPSIQESAPKTAQPPADVVSEEKAKSFPDVNRKRYPKQSAGIHAKTSDVVARASTVLEKLTKEPQVGGLLSNAKGVLLVPRFARGGLVVGGSGGKAVLVTRHDGQWTGPAIYNLGTVNIGPQAGAATGAVAMILMSDKAIAQFQKEKDIALNAHAGLTIVDYSKGAQARSGGDVVLWSDTRGAYAGATVGVTGMNFDREETSALFGQDVTARDVLTGAVQTAPANTLLSMLPAA